MARKESPVRMLLNPKRVVIPIAIGLGVASYMLYKNFNGEALSAINWSWYTLVWLVCALLMMFVRDLAYMFRIRLLTNFELSWRQSFEVIMLWEFASAVTPSAVGGTPIAIFIVNREGINIGRSATIVLITSLLDELFFILMVPILYLTIGKSGLFPIDEPGSAVSLAMGTKLLFTTSYALIALYSILISYGLLINPQAVRRLLVGIFSLPGLKKWKQDIEKTGDELVEASLAAKKMPFSLWFWAAASTFFSWTARYMVINCIIMAFSTNADHFLIYGRQLIMWVIMLISPTPGGAGLAEYAFSAYLSEFIPDGLESTLAFIWRLISYYPYLFIGAIILPTWVRRVYLKRKLIRFRSK